jgi:hypothetical protein
MPDYYNLTDHQKSILRELIEADQGGHLARPGIVLLMHGGDKYVVWGLQEDLLSTADLDELCDVGLLALDKPGRDPQYRITNAGRDAVANDFRLPREQAVPQMAVGNWIGQMTGGTVQGIGHMQASEARQIVNDPELLQAKLDEATEHLLREVKSALDQEAYQKYSAALEELKRQILADEPSPKSLQNLVRTISFLGDIEGTIQFMARLWPLIHPLLLMAAIKLATR